MRPFVLASTVALSLVWWVGCEGSSGPGTKSGAPGRQSSSPPPAPTAGQSGSTTPSGAPAAVTPRPVNVQLSAGVALPQSSPDGTLMSFSVDYQFTQGEPGSSEYSWVIERAAGPPATEMVRLERQGTLVVVMPGWRPEEGPFQSHLEDQQGVRVAATLKMR